MRFGSTTALLTQLPGNADRQSLRPAAPGLLPAPIDRMITPMLRRLHAGVSLLVLSLAGSGSAWAEAAGDDSASDSGWFDPAPEPAPASSQGLAPSSAAPAAPQP